MIKPELIKRLLESLHEQVELLRPMQKLSLKELADDGVRWNGVLHLLQVSVEHVTDISAHILAGSNRVVPDDYKEIIRSMGRGGPLPFEFAERIAPMAGFRNVVVHHYRTVDPQKVGDILYNHLSDFDEFAMYIYDYLRREGHLSSEEPSS